MVTIYKNKEIPNDYKFIDIHTDYVDFYNTDNIVTGQDYSIYRVYKDNEDLFININNTAYNTINLIEVNTTDNYIYRKDYKDILFVSFIYFLLIIFIINIITSIVKRNGVLGGLF